ncbi:MAG: C69 family dipeptidase [Candidatus Binataceae bacterium]
MALASRTESGATILAKNSDRPPRECQPLFQAPRYRYASGERVRCQYLEISQVPETCALIGSRPFWLWGFEHGINQHGVAIGNEALITKEKLPEIGLLGMDLVRLGLERGSSAREALEVISALIERHGQGGSGASDFDFRYSNGFIIADPVEAWTLESSGRQWAARRVTQCASVSNRISTTNYDLASPDVREYARSQGWWDGRGAFDFAASYSQEEHPTTFSARGRLRRSRELLARKGRLSAAEMAAALRDHYEMGEMPVISAPMESERHFSLCMHGELFATTASMIAELPPPDSGRAPAMWASMGAPCTGIFIPLYVEGAIPPVLKVGGPEPAPDSPWWRMKSIQDLVARSPERLAPKVWGRLRPLEVELFARAAEVNARVRGLDPESRAALLTAFMAESTERVLKAAAAVENDLRAST